MRTVSEINVLSKRTSPRGIVHPHISIEGHPVIYMGSVCRTAQRRIAFLVCDAVHASRRIVPPAHIPRHKIRLLHQLAVLVDPQMLVCQIYLHIAVSDIILAKLRCLRMVNRCSLPALPALDLLEQLLRLAGTVHPPAIRAVRHRDRLAVCRPEFPLPSPCVILPRKPVHVLPHKFGVETDHAVLHRDPVLYDAAVQHLCLLAKCICNRHPGKTVALLALLLQGTVV